MSKVSFGGSVVYTKNGNPYEKSRTGFLVGSGIGVIGGVINVMKSPSTIEKALSEKNIIPKLFKLNRFLMPLCIVSFGGAIIDEFINHSRKKVADETTQYYDNQENLNINV